MRQKFKCNIIHTRKRSETGDSKMQDLLKAPLARIAEHSRVKTLQGLCIQHPGTVHSTSNVCYYKTLLLVHRRAYFGHFWWKILEISAATAAAVMAWMIFQEELNYRNSCLPKRILTRPVKVSFERCCMSILVKSAHRLGGFMCGPS